MSLYLSSLVVDFHSLLLFLTDTCDITVEETGPWYSSSPSLRSSLPAPLGIFSWPDDPPLHYGGPVCGVTGIFGGWYSSSPSLSSPSNSSSDFLFFPFLPLFCSMCSSCGVTPAGLAGVLRRLACSITHGRSGITDGLVVRILHDWACVRRNSGYGCLLSEAMLCGDGSDCPLFEAMLRGDGYWCLSRAILCDDGYGCPLSEAMLRGDGYWCLSRAILCDDGYGCPLSEAMLCGDMYGCPCGDWCDCDCHQSTGLYHWHIDHVDSKPIIHTKSCWLWAVAAPGDPPVGVCQPPGWLLGLATGPDTLNPGLILWGCLYGWGCPYGWFTGLALTSEEPGCEYCKGLSQSQIIANKYIQNMTKANICTQMKI